MEQAGNNQTRSNSGEASAVSALGYGKIPEGRIWGNYRYPRPVIYLAYQAAHFPVSAFIKYGIHDVRLINCLDNLQPLEAYANLSKHDKYDKQEFEAWLEAKGVIWKL